MISVYHGLLCVLFAGLGALLSYLINGSILRDEVERLMCDGGEHSIRRARVLLSLRGHRLDKRTRDALTVWLARQP